VPKEITSRVARVAFLFNPATAFRADLDERVLAGHAYRKIAKYKQDAAVILLRQGMLAAPTSSRTDHSPASTSFAMASKAEIGRLVGVPRHPFVLSTDAVWRYRQQSW
jgi:hypothetical protein